MKLMPLWLVGNECHLLTYAINYCILPTLRATEFTILVAYYIDHHEGKDNFTTDDIKTKIKETRRQEPYNISDIIFRQVRKGYIIDPNPSQGRNKTYKMSSLGIDYCENFTPSKNTPTKKSTRKKTNKNNSNKDVN